MDIHREALATLLGAAIAVSLILIYNHNHQPVTSGPDFTAVEATKSPEIKGESTRSTPVANGNVQTYDDNTKGKLDLPDSVKSNPNKKVTSSVVVPPDDHEQEVTTVIDTSSGEFTSYIKEKPLPVMAMSFNRKIGGLYGWANGNKTARVYAAQNVLQIKSCRILGVVSMDQSIDTGKTYSFIGAGVECSI